MKGVEINVNTNVACIAAPIYAAKEVHHLAGFHSISFLAVMLLFSSSLAMSHLLFSFFTAERFWSASRLPKGRTIPPNLSVPSSNRFIQLAGIAKRMNSLKVSSFCPIEKPIALRILDTNAQIVTYLG